MTRPVLTLRDLSIDFPTSKGLVHAVKALDLDVMPTKKVGFIGESGSGKTTTALAIMRMLAEPGRIAGGEILLGETALLDLDEERMRKARLRRVSYIPQGAMNS
ncbi:MAG: ATP-binding cassette domain-containing protein, partial [Pseudomonadota bacterium]